MKNFLIIPILFIFLVSCSNSEDFNIPKISKLEKLEQHSNQFIKGIYSYDNGIHVAIGFGIANSIMVEGEGGNIIIDTTDDISQAKEVLSEFQKIDQNRRGGVLQSQYGAIHTIILHTHSSIDLRCIGLRHDPDFLKAEHFIKQL